MLSEVCFLTTRRSTAVAAGKCSRASIVSTSTTSRGRSSAGGRVSISDTLSTACIAVRTCSAPSPGQSGSRGTTRGASRTDPIQSKTALSPDLLGKRGDRYPLGHADRVCGQYARQPGPQVMRSEHTRKAAMAGKRNQGPFSKPIGYGAASGSMSLRQTRRRQPRREQ